MQVDFYQLSRDPVERVVPLLTDKALESGARVVIVSENEAQRETLSSALWAHENAFLAHGNAGATHSERQPILLADDCDASDGAKLALIADGKWREGTVGLERAILLFSSDQVEPARELWRTLKGSGRELRFFSQDDQGRWKQAG